MVNLPPPPEFRPPTPPLEPPPDDPLVRAVALWIAGDHNKSHIADMVGLDRRTVRARLIQEFGRDQVLGHRELVPTPRSSSRSAPGGEHVADDDEQDPHAAGHEDDDEHPAAPPAPEVGLLVARRAGEPPDAEWDDDEDEDGDGEPAGEGDAEERAAPVLPGSRSRLVYGMVAPRWVDPDGDRSLASVSGNGGGGAQPLPPAGGGTPVPEGPPRGDRFLLVQDLTFPIPQALISMWYLIQADGYTGTLADWIVECVEDHITKCKGWKMAIVFDDAAAPAGVTA